MHTNKCVIKECKFPNTCSWNKRCMQMGLQLSISSKKIVKPKVDKRKNYEPNIDQCDPSK